MSEPYVVDVHEVPTEEGLDPDEGWINMKVQFLVNAEGADSEELVVGRTIFPPGTSMHGLHRHANADEFVYLVRGSGILLHEDKEVPLRTGQVAFHGKGVWHGFRNTSDTEEAEMIWAWGGAGSRDEAGYEAKPDS